MKTAIVHDWFYSISGAEKVVEAIYSIFPSPIYSLIKNSVNLKGSSLPIDAIHTSFIQRLPKATTRYPYYLPLFPLAIESLNLFDADVILSSSSCVAKNVLTHANQLHICYCHTPMRYIWDMHFEYLKEHRLNKGAKGFLAKLLSHYLRSWDLTHAQRVDHYIANSACVAKRIFKTYRKQATIIYPPVDVEFFSQTMETKADFYLTASRLVPYKKIDLIVKTFAHMPNKKLLVIGDGPQMAYIKKLAPKNVTLLGKVSDIEMRSYIQQAKAFIYMAYEDFGILPVEAQAAGTPVIAFSQGGCKETVISGKTGLLVNSQSEKALIETIQVFENSQDAFDPIQVKSHARQFSKERFVTQYKETVKRLSQEFFAK